MPDFPLRRAYEVQAVTPGAPYHAIELWTPAVWAVDALGLPVQVYRTVDDLLAAHPVVLRPSRFVFALWSRPSTVFRLARPLTSTRGRLRVGTAVRCVHGYPFDDDDVVTFDVLDGPSWQHASTRDRMVLR